MAAMTRLASGPAIDMTTQFWGLLPRAEMFADAAKDKKCDARYRHTASVGTRRMGQLMH